MTATEQHPFAIECPATRGLATHQDAHWVFKFSNGRGASVVRGEYTYGGPGLWELAVLSRDGDLDYTTEITSDVVGWLAEDDVTELLHRIGRLA